MFAVFAISIHPQTHCCKNRHHWKKAIQGPESASLKMQNPQDTNPVKIKLKLTKTRTCAYSRSTHLSPLPLPHPKSNNRKPPEERGPDLPMAREWETPFHTKTLQREYSEERKRQRYPLNQRLCCHQHTDEPTKAYTSHKRSKCDLHRMIQLQFLWYTLRCTYNVQVSGQNREPNGNESYN